MPETISKSDNRQIIGGVFSNRKNADEAIKAFRQRGIPEQDLQVVVKLTDDQADDAYSAALVGRGFAESQALFYDKAIRNGKILVAVHNVVDPAPIIEIFDDNKAEYNPDGSRNLRQDVFGMTAGAVAGAIAGGAAGTAVAGPIGGAVGAAAGAVVGAGAGGAAGKATEHRK
ncbi:MAG: general stress protein [Methylacidiphilales bacterium]|nr:general stress protein [Candidatus Methylacidiphilales bacterium]